MNGSKKQGHDEFRNAVTITVVWVAGLNLVVIFVALIVGILLDKLFHSKPLFTAGLMITSIPLSIYLTYQVVKAATRRIQPVLTKESLQEEPHRGEDA
jgi:F0F1-type ATP synthase assembly protein I